MSKDPFIGRLPDGTISTSLHDHAKVWGEMANLLCEQFDLTCVGFDPGFQFIDDRVGGIAPRVFTLPAWFAIRLLEKTGGARPPEG